MADDRPNPWIGTRIGGYVLDAQIGRGGSAEVFRAHSVHGGPAVALKLLRPNDEEARHQARLERELRVARRLQHPNALRILNIGTDNEGRPYLVTELLEGETLRDRLRRDGALPMADAIGIARAVLPVLREAHGEGLVHRDLKPENLFLTGHGGQRGSGGRAPGVKVLDFGLVKSMTGTDSLGKITRTGMIGGTPRYVSPENAQGYPLDGRSDLYSLGVVLFEMLSGAAPFQGGSPLDQLLQHIHDPVPPLTSPHSALPDALVACVYRCLEKRPDRRPADAEAVDATLAGISEATSKVGAVQLGAATAGYEVPEDDIPTESMRPTGDDVTLASRVRNTRKRRALGLAGTVGIVVVFFVVWLTW